MSQNTQTAYCIQNLTADDLDKLCLLETACFAKPWSKQMFTGEFQNPAAHYSGVFCAEQLVAYLGIWYVCDEGQITNVAVHPAHRRRGLAKELLFLAAQKAQKAGIAQITLEVREHNTAAICLYQGLGFETVGHRKGYYENREDALLMTWFLAAHEGEKTN